jgi:hypothetical protein
MVFATVGRVMSAAEVMESNYMTEGRDAIRNAMTELKRTGYIKAVKEQTAGGRWVTSLKFTEVGQKYVDLFNWNYQPVPTPEFPYVGEPGTTSNITTNDYQSLEVLRTSNTSGTPKSKEGSEMTWPGMEEEQEPQSRSQVRRIAIQSGDDDIAGAVGKFEDKKAHQF